MSTPTPGQSQQLESLVTSIFMNADQFNTESGKVLATIDAIKEKFALMGAMITRAASSISHGISTANQGLQSTLQELTSKSNFGQIGQGVDGLTKSLKSLQTGLDKLNKNSSVVTTFTQNLSGFTAELNKLVGVATGITTLQTNLENFVKALGTMAAQLPKGASDFTRSLGQIGKFLDGVNNLNFDNLHQLPVAMNSFFRRMGKVLGGVDLSALQIATSALSRMGTFMNALSKFKYTSVQAKSLAQMQGALSRLFDTMSHVGGLKDIDKAGVAMGHMSSMMRVMGQSSPKRIGSLVQPLDSLLNVFSKVPPDQIANTAKSFGALSRAMRNMAGAIPSNLVASAQATARAISILNSINVGKNAVQAANVISKIGAAMKNVGAGGPPGAGGKAGGWMSSFFNSIQGVSGAASAASGNVARLGYDFMALERNADSAGASLLSLRYGLLGLGAVGLFQFAQLDDALMRLSVHSRDFNQSNRAFITQGIFSLSGKSTSSAKEMALALDNLMSSGLSASMAMKVLATAEDYAVASGMKLSESAKGLNDLMHSMNLVPYEEGADGVEKYLANYQKLADLIVGVAPQVGSTEKEMMGAFTSRFMTASRLANMSIEESITVLGLMSRAGEAYRGQKGGNIAARGIEILALRSVPNRQMWLHMLGSEAQDAAGEVKPLFELLELMQKKMAATGTEKFIAEMMKLGIKDTESFNAVEPLLRTVAGAKDLRREMEFMKDAAKKAADAIRMSLKSQMMILWNTALNTALVVGSHLAPALYLITKPITDMLYSFTMLNPAIQNFVVLATTAYLALGPWRTSLLSLGKLAISPILNMASAFIYVFKVIMNFGIAILNIPTMIADAFASVKKFLLDVWTVITKIAMTIASPFVAAFGAVWFVVKNVFWGISEVIGVMQKLFDVITDSIVAVYKTGLNLLSFLGSMASMASMLLTSLVGAASFFLIIGPGLAVLTTLVGGAFAAIGAVVGTLIIGVGQLVYTIGVGLVAAWGEVRKATTSAIGWIGSKVNEISSSVTSVWDNMKSSLAGFLGQFKEAVTFMAGFLWNIKENGRIVFDWLGQHGEQAFKDLATAVFIAIEVTGGNLMKMLKGAANAAMVVGAAIWNTVVAYGGGAVNWLYNNMSNLAHDIGLVFQSVIKSIGDNFLLLLPIFDVIGDYLYRVVNYSFMMSEAENKRDRENVAFLIKDRISSAFRKMKGPLDNLDTSKFKTDVKETEFAKVKGSQWADMIKEANASTATTWGNVGEDMARAFSKEMASLQPILAGFELLKDSPIWNQLLSALNLTLPDSKTAADYYKKATGLAGGEGTGPSLETRGREFSLKQSSAARFEFGGQELYRIQYQQLVTLQAINSTLQTGFAQRGIPAANPHAIPIRTMPTAEPTLRP